jgi:putative heme-binding domain-containing protein
MARADVKPAPAEWPAAVSKALGDTDPALLRDALTASRTLAAHKELLPQLTPALIALGHRANAAGDLRLEALAILPSGSFTPDDELFAWIKAQLASSVTAERGTAATLLARMKLSPSQREELISTIPKLGPLELGKLLQAFESGLGEPLARKLLDALSNAPALTSLAPQTVRATFAKFPETLRPDCDALLARLQLDTASQRAHLDKIAGELPPGDIRRGQAVFMGPKAGCITCHTIGYVGGKLGPDLSSIDKVRTERDLLEAIVFPSASFVRSYEPAIVHTKKGEDFLGIVRADTADGLTLAAGPAAELRFARADIAEVRPATVSLMPQGFDQILTRQELSDLVTFLKSPHR